MKRLFALFLLFALLLAGCAPQPGPAPSSGPESGSMVQGEGSLTPPAMTLGSDEVPGWREGETPFPLTSTTEALPPFQFSDGAEDARVSVFSGEAEGEPIFSGSQEEFSSFAPPANGTYLIEIEKSYAGDKAGSYTGRAVYRLAVTYDLKPVLTLEGAPVKQGGTGYLRLRNLPSRDAVPQISSPDLGFTPTFYPYEDGLIALVPARYLLEAGTYLSLIHI